VKQKQSSRRRRSSTQIRPTFARPGIRQAATLNSLNSADAKRGYRHAIDEFVDCIVRNRAWDSTGSWSCGIARISNPVNSALAQSICVLAPCAASHTKRPTAALKIKSPVRYLVENSTKSLCQLQDSDAFRFLDLLDFRSFAPLLVTIW